MAVKQTAGRDALGEFAPKFAELNDEVLFGQVWSREDKLSLRDRSLVTVVALMAQGLPDSSFRYHLTAAKNNGITRTEIAEILTHAAFYAGWPKAWAAFRMAKEVWAEDAAEDAKAKHQSEMVFPIGASNDGFAQYFSGKSYLAPCPPHRLACTTSPLSRAAATTGTFTTRAVRFSCARQAAVTIRNGARNRRNFIPATSSTFRRK